MHINAIYRSTKLSFTYLISSLRHKHVNLERFFYEYEIDGL